MTTKYPDDSIQSLVGEWWHEVDTPYLRRGRLLKAFVPHVDQQPMALVLEGRSTPTEHSKATFRVEPLHAGRPPKAPRLPVAAMPHVEGEPRVVYRGKPRPVVILSMGGPDVPAPLRTGGAKWQSAPTLVVAPFYGCDHDGTRAGWQPEFVARIRRCEYPQYVWDRLPLDGSSESILRLDHLMPIGRHADAYAWTPHCLTDDALQVLDEWLVWLGTDRLPANGVLLEVREQLLKVAAVA